MSVTHWAKKEREEKLTKILELIQKHEPLRYMDLKEQATRTDASVSDPTLSGYLKELETRGLIEHFEKEDRREKWYRIKSETKVNTQLQKHEAKHLIDSMSHYVTGVKDRPIHNSKVSFHVLVKLGEIYEKRAKEKGINEDEIIARLREEYKEVVEWGTKELGHKTAEGLARSGIEKGFGLTYVIKVEKV